MKKQVIVRQEFINGQLVDVTVYPARKAAGTFSAGNRYAKGGVKGGIHKGATKSVVRCLAQGNVPLDNERTWDEFVRL